VLKPFDIKTLLIRIDRGLFKSNNAKNAICIDSNGILSKSCFLSSYLDYEIARAKRFLHPLSLLLIKINPRNVDKYSLESDTEIIELLRHRASDKLINWGKNMFALLLTETTASDATFIAHRISWQIGNMANFLKPHVGIANLEDTHVDSLIANAESSLGIAERLGGVALNRFIVHQ